MCGRSWRSRSVVGTRPTACCSCRRSWALGTRRPSCSRSEIADYISKQSCRSTHSAPRQNEPSESLRLSGPCSCSASLLRRMMLSGALRRAPLEVLVQCGGGKNNNQYSEVHRLSFPGSLRSKLVINLNARAPTRCFMLRPLQHLQPVQRGGAALQHPIAELCPSGQTANMSAH